MAIFAREQRKKHIKDSRSWQEKNSEKYKKYLKEYRKEYKKNKPKVIKIYDNHSNRSLRLSDTEIKLKKCFITCKFKDPDCDLVKCASGCKNNIQRKYNENDIEAKNR